MRISEFRSLRVLEFNASTLKLFNSLTFKLSVFISGIFFSVSSADLSVDWAAFNYKNELSLVEIYYSCPYRTLQYIAKNDTIFAPYKISFQLKSTNSADSLVDIINRRAIIPSFEIAQRRDMKLVDGFGFFARPGTYWFNITLSESLPVLSYNDTIIVEDFSKSLALSNIELASSVITDSSGGKFTKGKLRIVPNPELCYGQAYEFAYVYIEGYNLTIDTLPYELSYRILSSDKSVVKSFPIEVKKKTDKNFAYTFAFSTKGLSPGSYFLRLSLVDYSSGNQAIREKEFSVIPKVTDSVSLRPLSLVSDSGFSPPLADLGFRLLATPSELKQYNNLNELGRKEFLRRFWQKHNFEEFVKRIKFADDNYKLGRRAGNQTDRGRIYIKYGPPDEVVMHTMVEHVKPHEHWNYYSLGIQFVFTDIHENGTFQLIYSNTDAEPKNPNWEKYIDPLELDDLR